MKSRRSFIKNTSVGLLSTLVFNSVKDFWGLSQFAKNEIPTWESLVDLARWCPTVHNLQPHQVKVVSATEAELYYDPSRLLTVGDPNSIFATVAMGVFIEHLSISAAPSGYQVRITKMYDPISTQVKGSTLFAKIEIKSSTKKETLGSELIKERRTAREAYNGKPLKIRTVNLLETQAENYNQEFFHTSDQKHIDLIVKLNQQTLFEDLESKPNREELDRLFRYCKNDAATKKDGLWSKCMGFSGNLLKSVFQKHEKWTKGTLKKLLSKRYTASYNGTRSFCWIAGKFDNTGDWLEAGRFLARNWLLVTKEGAYLQPTGSLITNAKAYKKMKSMLPQPSGQNKIWMGFRAGYSKKPVRSYRLNTNEILIK